jgi:hypothetical protein
MSADKADVKTALRKQAQDDKPKLVTADIKHHPVVADGIGGAA